MLQFKLNGETLQMPEIHELTYDKFVKLIDLKTDRERIELLTGADMSKLPATAEKAVANLIGLIDGLIDEIAAYLANPIAPEEKYNVTFFDRPFYLTKDLGKLPYWPMTKVKDMIKAMGKEPFNKYDHYKSLVGHYVYEKATGLPYDEYKAEQFCEDVIGTMPFQVVLGLGDFFLYMQRHLWLPKKDCSQMKQALKKSARVLKFSTSMVN